MAGHQRAVDTPAGGGHPDPGGQRTGGALYYGWAYIHAYAMGEGRIRREPKRGGREDVSTVIRIVNR